MKRKRRWARELVLKILYAKDINEQSLNDFNIDYFLEIEEKDYSKDLIDYAQALLKGVSENILEIDKIISKYSKNWKLERQNVVDRNILRMAIYELLCFLEVPNIVVIDEAIELAKKYSDKDSPSFVNGVLDAVRKDYNGCILGETDRLSSM
jgi:N utilization substance protein B